MDVLGAWRKTGSGTGSGTLKILQNYDFFRKQPPFFLHFWFIGSKTFCFLSNAQDTSLEEKNSKKDWAAKSFPKLYDNMHNSKKWGPERQIFQESYFTSN